MPEFNPSVHNPSDAQQLENNDITQEKISDITQNEMSDNSVEEQEQEESKKILGLSEEEIKDPNKIKVEISDTQTPIVILYGPPSCGKTMTLRRLTRYLLSEGYTIETERGFRPTADTHYRKMCEEFDQIINSDYAASSTSLISFMLVKVYKNGRCLCQILEAPGEYYFVKSYPNAPYPFYFHTIKNSPNRKVWAIMVEPDWEDPQDRKNYVSRIHKLKSQIHPTDKVVFMYNKIDKTQFVVSPGVVRMGETIQRVKQDYPNMFVPFKNTNPITKLWKEYDCSFIPFQTGDYVKTSDGSMVFSEGPYEYPRQLWNELKKQI